MPAPNYNLFDLLHVLLKWKKPILYVSLSAAVISSIISFLVPVYYKSTAIFYAYNLKSFDPRNISSEEVMEIFGDKEDADRLVTIGSSSGLENRMITKFNLFKRYDIDSTDTYARTNVVETLRANMNVIKNERSAIEVTVYDKDPAIAAQMANEAVKIMDEINKGPVMENNRKLLYALKDQLDAKYAQLDSLSHGIRNLKKENASSAKTAYQYFDDLKSVDVRLTEDLAEAIKLKEKYDMAAALYNSNVSSIFIVEPAGISEKKAKPIRWLIVLTSTLAALMLVCLLAIFLEVYKNNGVTADGNRS
jgi:uncharacterized protein involved in exopolysaccharide biosynthesis